MYFGYLSLQSYTFLGFGLGLVMAVGLGLILVYAVGSSRGKKAARTWVTGCIALLVVGTVADVVFAVLTRQWESFLLSYGIGALLEMSTMAVLFLGSMWFMAIRYTQGLEE